MLQLHDGRTLGYVEYGSPTGKPLVYFHGHPSSRFEAGFLAEQAIQTGIRLIGVDRPGMGLSTYKSGRRFLDWPDDVLELADSLQINRFAVAGFSGGSPYALACAFKIPHRLLSCGIISGVGHTGRFRSFLSLWLPWLIMPLSKRFFQDEARAQRTLLRVARTWGEPDRNSLSSPRVSEILAASLVESFRHGTKEAAYEGRILGARGWGFRLEDIQFQNIYLWHGALDKQIPVAQGRTVTERLAFCKATFYPNDGHVSVIANHQEEIVKTLVDA